MSIIWVLLALAAGAAWVIWWLQTPTFGGRARGARLARMQASPQWRAGVFHNTEPTPMMTGRGGYPQAIYELLFQRAARRVPKQELPVERPNLHQLPAEANVLVWFGHSSYLLQVEGKRFLVDPVFSRDASPVPGSNRAFRGTDAFRVSDLPPVDYLLLTHDHYDHLDYATVRALQPKVGHVITGLGVGAHLARWGYPETQITELDWQEELPLAPGIVLHATPARHFSGRGFRRNSTLWLSFVLQTPRRKLFLGGDSGYGAHFAAIGRAHGPFDLALLECGQYNRMWQYIHMLPDELLPAARDLDARAVVPVHNSKFAMANHDWDEPLAQVTRLNAESKAPLPLITPRIGEVVDLNAPAAVYSQWWAGKPRAESGV